MSQDFFARPGFRSKTVRKTKMAKYRCAECRNYYPVGEVFFKSSLTRLCSPECLSQHRAGQKPTTKKPKPRAKPRKQPHRIAGPLRYEIRERDKHSCRWCGEAGTEIHHVVYRSSGGPDEPSNLILLCQGCHMRAHSSKRAFQPLLLAVIWEYYVNGRSLTVPQVARMLDAQGMLTKLQRERMR